MALGLGSRRAAGGPPAAAHAVPAGWYSAGVPGLQELWDGYRWTGDTRVVSVFGARREVRSREPGAALGYRPYTVPVRTFGRITVHDDPHTGRRSYWPALFLALLGSPLGADRFYIGKWGTAAAKLALGVAVLLAVLGGPRLGGSAAVAAMWGGWTLAAAWLAWNLGDVIVACFGGTRDADGLKLRHRELGRAVGIPLLAVSAVSGVLWGGAALTAVAVVTGGQLPNLPAAVAALAGR